MVGETHEASGKTRAASHRNEERFRHVIEKNADGLVVVAHDGTILYVNPAAEQLLDREADECEGSPFGIPLAADERTEIDIVRDGRAFVAEMRVTETEWEGRPAYLASLRDVTERKQMEGRLRDADRRKDEFLAMLSHELRNPLAAIGYALPLLRPGAAHDDADAAFETAERQVRHLARLVDDLLDVSRITTGKIELRREPVDVVAAAARVVEALSAAAEARGHRLSAELPDRPAWVDADVTRLEQVVSNLLNNAVKYTPDGGRIQLIVETEDDEVLIRVRDGGIGISPEMLPKVFDLFAQVDGSLDRSQGGLGIGLTLVRSLVELHGGVVTAASEGVGRGCEFAVRLPLLPATVTPQTPQVSGPGPPRTRSLRILIVEDQVATATLLAKLLERGGHEVWMAQNGPDALAAASVHRPDLILLDIGLPGMDGYQVAARLREIPDFERTHLVALTGYGQEEDRRRSLNAGFDRHLIKPIDLAVLETVFAEILRSHAADAC